MFCLPLTFSRVFWYGAGAGAVAVLFLVMLVITIVGVRSYVKEVREEDVGIRSHE